MKGVVVVGLLLQGCFLLVSSGIRREIPPGAVAASGGMVSADEVVVAAWDGSVLQDGGLLAILTDHHIMKRAGEELIKVDLRDVQTIVVNEDDGVVDVVTTASRLSLPLRSSEERRAFAHLIQTEVQKRKKAIHEDRDTPPTLDSAPAPAHPGSASPPQP